MNFQKSNPNQNPQVEGDVDRVMFGSPETRGKNGILIKDIKKQETEKEGKKEKETILEIEAGSIIGAFPGGSVFIYKKIGDNEPLAMGEIIESGDFTSKVRVIEKEVPENSKVILATPYFGSNKRILALDITHKKENENDDVGFQMIKRTVQKLEKNAFVSTKALDNPFKLENKKDWDIALVRGNNLSDLQSAQNNKSDENVGLLCNNEKFYYLTDKNGIPIYNFWVYENDKEAEIKIQDAVEKFVRADNLRTLTNSPEELKNGLDFKIRKLIAKKEILTTIGDVKEGNLLENSQLKVGDYFSFEIENKTGKDLFPYIYSIGTDGSIKLLYEPKADGDILKPNILLKTIKSEIIAQTSLPLGVETFKLITTTERFNGRLLESIETARTTKSIKTPLEVLLLQAGINERTSNPIAFEFSGWTTLNLDVEIISQKNK